MSECSICLTNCDITKSYITLCNHAYCFDCIILWLNTQETFKLKPTCPICRSLLDIAKIKSEYKIRFPSNDENKILSFDELIKLNGVGLHHNMLVIDILQDKNNFYESLKSLIGYSIIKSAVSNVSILHNNIERLNMNIEHNNKSYKMFFRTPIVNFMIALPSKYNPDMINTTICIRLDNVNQQFVNGIEQLESLTRKIINIENPECDYRGIIKHSEEHSKLQLNYIRMHIAIESCSFFSDITPDAISIKNSDDIAEYTAGGFIFEHQIILMSDCTTKNNKIKEAYSKLKIVQVLLTEKRTNKIKKYLFDQS